jgi:hypothetical protein
MNPVKFLGILCMCLGVATMLLGTAMVPVAAPVWGDMEAPFEPPKKCVESICNACGNAVIEGSPPRYYCGTGVGPGWVDGSCKTKNSPGGNLNCNKCTGDCWMGSAPGHEDIRVCYCED